MCLVYRNSLPVIKIWGLHKNLTLYVMVVYHKHVELSSERGLSPHLCGRFLEFMKYPTKIRNTHNALLMSILL